MSFLCCAYSLTRTASNVLALLLAFTAATEGLAQPDAKTTGPATAAAPLPAAHVVPLTRDESEAERRRQLLESRPKGYEDKVMDERSLSVLEVQDARVGDEQPAGLRSFALESRFGFVQVGSQGGGGLGGSSLNTPAHAALFGIRSEYRRETFNYGEFVTQVDVRGRGGDAAVESAGITATQEKQAARVTLRNFGFPLGSGTYANSALGDIGIEITDALARRYRLSLGTSVVRGVAAQVSPFDRLFDLRMGFGERGSLTGEPYPGFERSRGILAWLGYSSRVSGDFYVGAQASYATGVNGSQFVSTANQTRVNGARAAENGASVAAAFGYGADTRQEGASSARATVVVSHIASSDYPASTSPKALFAEGVAYLGRYRNDYGVYWAEPNLRFGDSSVASGSRGFYWRLGSGRSRLGWGIGLDYDQQLPSTDLQARREARFGVRGDIDYRIDRADVIGGGISISESRFSSAGFSSPPALMIDISRSLNLNGYYQLRSFDWGRSRVSATLRHNQIVATDGSPATGQQLQWEHDWITGKYETMRPEFTTTLGVARDVSSGTTTLYPTAGVTFRYWPDADWNVGGNIRYSARNSNLTADRGLAVGLSSEKTLGNGWRVGLTTSVNESRANATGFALSEPLVTRSNYKLAYLYLRWDGSNGRPYEVKGFRTLGASGGGSLTGQVFFDANRDGEQQFDERGAPNVEVFLDGRYRVTTDKDGRFLFPMVTSGEHRLTVRPETVPLPWGPSMDRGVTVTVSLRQETNARIALIKIGD